MFPHSEKVADRKRETFENIFFGTHDVRIFLVNEKRKNEKQKKTKTNHFFTKFKSETERIDFIGKSPGRVRLIEDFLRPFGMVLHWISNPNQTTDPIPMKSQPFRNRYLFMCVICSN